MLEFRDLETDEGRERALLWVARLKVTVMMKRHYDDVLEFLETPGQFNRRFNE